VAVRRTLAHAVLRVPLSSIISRAELQRGTGGLQHPETFETWCQHQKRPGNPMGKSGLFDTQGLVELFT
jgi:hypothetical protein